MYCRHRFLSSDKTRDPGSLAFSRSGPKKLLSSHIKLLTQFLRDPTSRFLPCGVPQTKTSLRFGPKHKTCRRAGLCVFGPPGWIRTNHQFLKRELLYQMSYGRMPILISFRGSKRKLQRQINAHAITHGSSVGSKTLNGERTCIRDWHR